MAIEIGRVLRKRREWARLTQQELVDHTGLDRSASYISAIETGRTSPTLFELERLARYFRLTILELLEEAMESPGAPSAASTPDAPPSDDRLQRSFAGLGAQDQELAIEFVELLARRAARR